ncbi:MAG: PRC-barrel domain-containing protein [Parvibaculum sp.]
MKHLLVGACLLALVSPALASTWDNYAETSAAEVPGMPPGIDPARIQMSPGSTAPHPLVRETQGRAIVLSSGGLSTRFLIGVRVTDEAGDPVGTIENLVFSPGGRVERAILSVGGFMGLGAKDVAVPFGKFTISGESHEHPTARTSSTLAELKALPVFRQAGLASGEALASDILGATLKPRKAGGEAVKLTDIIIDPDGAGHYAAVEYGGIDGFGAKRTVVEFSTLGDLTAKPAIPLNLKMAALRKAQPFIYNVNGSTTSIPEILND